MQGLAGWSRCLSETDAVERKDNVFVGVGVSLAEPPNWNFNRSGNRAEKTTYIDNTVTDAVFNTV